MTDPPDLTEDSAAFAPVRLDLPDPWNGGANSVRLMMLRLDRLDGIISGNKWFKLTLNLHAAVEADYKSVLTFGGAWSNHLVATAAAASRRGLASTGIVRGLHAKENLTATLKQCRELGMELKFVSRAEYELKNDPEYLKRLSTETGNPFIIPEGGANEAGRAGAGIIARYIPGTATDICLPAGTGTTLAGLREALPVRQRLTGFAPMKDGAYLNGIIPGWLSREQDQNWQVTDRYHFGGFGKMTDGLRLFMEAFERKHGIPLDRVYTAKMMYGVLDLLHQGYFPSDAEIICIHTGGLQGNASLLQGNASL